jgi:hypothetical protein
LAGDAAYRDRPISFQWHAQIVLIETLGLPTAPNAAQEATRRMILAQALEHGYDESAINAGALLEALVPIANIEVPVIWPRTPGRYAEGDLCAREFADRVRKAPRRAAQADGGGAEAEPDRAELAKRYRDLHPQA